MTQDAQNELERLMYQHGIDVPTKTGHIVGRGKPYTPPTPEAEPPVMDYQMKRFMAAVGFCAFCVCCMKAAERGSFDGGLTIVGWAVGITVAYALLRKVSEDCLEWKNGDADAR